MAKTSDEKTAIDAALDLQKTTPDTDPVRTFRDKVYTSRTLILPGGATLPVAKGRAMAVDGARGAATADAVRVVVGLGRRVRQCRPFHLYRRGGRRAPWG